MLTSSINKQYVLAHRKFELTKPLWDTVSLERVDVATDVTRKADLAAVVMQEGLANVCLVTASMTLVRKKIEVNIPRYISKHVTGFI